MILYVYYSIFCVIALGVAVFAYRALRNHGRAPALAAGIGCLLVLILLYPIPIHGGFTFLVRF